MLLQMAPAEFNSSQRKGTRHTEMRQHSWRLTKARPGPAPMDPPDVTAAPLGEVGSASGRACDLLRCPLTLPCQDQCSDAGAASSSFTLGFWGRSRRQPWIDVHYTLHLQGGKQAGLRPGTRIPPSQFLTLTPPWGAQGPPGWAPGRGHFQRLRGPDRGTVSSGRPRVGSWAAGDEVGQEAPGPGHSRSMAW